MKSLVKYDTDYDIRCYLDDMVIVINSRYILNGIYKHFVSDYEDLPRVDTSQKLFTILRIYNRRGTLYFVNTDGMWLKKYTKSDISELISSTDKHKKLMLMRIIEDCEFYKIKCAGIHTPV